MKSLFLAFLLMGVSVALAVEGPSAAPEPAQPNDRHHGDPFPRYCCFDFVRRPVPLRVLKSFEYGNERCSKPAVVFLTKAGRQICANPSERWVQDRMRDLPPS